MLYNLKYEKYLPRLQDGTVIVHTVRRGHYMRTLRPPCTMGYTLNIPHMVMDDMGRIVLYCHETLPIEPKVQSCQREREREREISEFASMSDIIIKA